MRTKRRKHYRTHYDLPLKFDYLPRDPDFEKRLWERFEIPVIRSKLRRQALLHLVSAATMGSWIDSKTSVSLSKAWYTGKQNIYGKSFSYTHIRGAFDHIEKLEKSLFGMTRKRPSSRNRDQSTFWASDDLLKFVENDDFSPVSAQPIRLRNLEGKPVAYSRTPETDELESRMVRINNQLRKNYVSFSSRYKRVGNRVRVGDQWFVEGPVDLYRIFCREDFRCHGRLYGRHTGLRSKSRSRMLFNGEKAGELDFSGLHPHMVYASEGIQLTRDIYDIGAWDRNKVWKKAFNIGLNAPSESSAGKALARATRFPQFQGRFLIRLTKCHNSEIAHHFGSDAGIFLQYRESEMILEIMEILLAEGIMNLPVHDSIIAPLKHEQRVIEVMEKTYSKHNNGFTCKVSRK